VSKINRSDENVTPRNSRKQPYLLEKNILQRKNAVVTGSGDFSRFRLGKMRLKILKAGEKRQWTKRNVMRTTGGVAAATEGQSNRLRKKASPRDAGSMAKVVL